MQVMLTGICSKALVCSLEPRINLGGHEIRSKKIMCAKLLSIRSIDPFGDIGEMKARMPMSTANAFRLCRKNFSSLLLVNIFLSSAISSSCLRLNSFKKC